MIKNDLQLTNSKRRLVELEQKYQAIRIDFADKPNKANLLSLGFREHISQLKEEIAEYLKIKTDPVPSIIRVQGPEELRRRIVELRIKRKVTQAELAKKIGCKQSDISRMERKGYGGFSLSTLDKIAQALDAILEVSLITMPLESSAHYFFNKNISTTFSASINPASSFKSATNDSISGDYANA